VLASGTTNAAFNWAVTLDDVVRVVLLFYLMPLWAVLLARLILGERLSAAAGLRVALALAGALIVLWPGGEGAQEVQMAKTGQTPLSLWEQLWLSLPLPRNAADALGLLGGFSFALNNVLLRREAAAPEEARALAMFTGGVLVSGVLGFGLLAAGHIPALPAVSWQWLPAAALLALAFLLGNLCLQYGAAHLSANTTAAVMVCEVLFASVSAIALGASSASLPLLIGGSLIVAASLLAAWRSQ
jgi:drug/metabolite transporter (DMT)-like permease